MAKSFVIIDESKVNSYGFRTMVDGVDIEQYNNNPIMLWMHCRPFGGHKDDILPIGRVVNLRIEGTEPGKKKLVGDPEFDLKDEFAKKIAQKVEDEFIKMASAGIDPKEWTDDPALRLPGQIGFTLVKSKLFEVSIVDIGSDDGALALWRDGVRLQLSAGGENKDIPVFTNHINNPNLQTDMKAIALKLGLPETATEQEILNKISQITGFQTENVALKSQLDAIRLARITSLVDKAVTERRITADKKDHFIQMGKSMGDEQLEVTLSLIPVAPRPTDVLNLSRSRGAGIPGVSTTTEAKKLSELPGSEAVRLRSEDRDEYIRLYTAEYGEAPRFE